MNQPADAFLVITIFFLLIGLVFIFFILFHQKKMIENRTKVTELELAKSKQDLKDSIDIQEKERARVGADLHDELGPTLSAVKLKIHSMKQVEASLQTELTQLHDLLDQTIRNVRHLSHSLYPNTLQEFGLKAALDELIRRIKHLANVEFTLNINGNTETLAFHDQLSIYRIVQEFINNSLKHGQASSIVIDFMTDANTWTLHLTDNGKGFNVSEKAMQGLGVKNMRMRAESARASFVLSSTPGKGTKIVLQHPIYAS